MQRNDKNAPAREPRGVTKRPNGTRVKGGAKQKEPQSARVRPWVRPSVPRARPCTRPLAQRVRPWVQGGQRTFEKTQKQRKTEKQGIPEKTMGNKPNYKENQNNNER